MKRKKTKIIELSMLFLSICLVLYNCKKQEVLYQESYFKTVSIQESLRFLQSEVNLKNKSANTLSLDIDFDKATYEDLIDSNEKITVIPATTQYKSIYSRVVLMRINGNIKSVIINMMPSDSTKLFTGRIGITNLEGEFIIGYRVNNGTLISKLVKSNKTTTMHRKGQGELCDYHSDGDPNCMFTDTVLDEVVITVQSNDQGLDPFDEGGSDYEDDLSNPEWNFGDGNPNGGNNNNSDTCPGNKVKNPSTGICECPKGYIEDFNGNCVIDPCSKIKLENQNPVFYNKINSLKGKTNQITETGYRQNKDGSYTQLTDTNNGHSLIIPIDRLSTVGFMHTHLDDYLTGEIDEKTGLPKKNKPIRMFSPADILKFLQIVKNTKYNGVPLSSVYGTMVSSSGTYTLRFTGNPNDISNSYDLNKEEFEEYIKENGKEKGFLKYLKDKVTINGIELYKVKGNGTVQKKTLSTDGKNVNPEDCN